MSHAISLRKYEYCQQVGIIGTSIDEEDEYLNISELSSFQDEDGDDRTDDDEDSDTVIDLIREK